MKLNCIVVDDSSIQRMTITKLVNESTLLNLVDDFANALCLHESGEASEGRHRGAHLF